MELATRLRDANHGLWDTRHSGVHDAAHDAEMFFFFQADDGIRDATVTGVQTCALPIFGSASDEPFASLDEVTVRATAFLRVPQGARNAWLFTLNYSNYSEYFAGLPIPGIHYVHSPSDRFTLVLGFPFNMLEWRPLEKLTVQLIYQPVRTVKAR